jgi:uncharacterized protein
MKFSRRVKLHLIRLFRIQASPHQVALGFTLGFIPNWFPTFGLGPILSMGLAKIAKVNIIAAVIGGVIGTPLWPVLFLLNYKCGSLFHMRPTKVDELQEVDYLEVVDTVSSFQAGSTIFLTGAILNVLIFSFLVYLIVYFIFKRYRASILLMLR